MRRLILSSIPVLLLVPHTSAQDLHAFYVGHSLSDGVIEMVNSLAAHHPEVGFTFRYQSIPGSPLFYNWDAKQRDDYPVNDPFYCGFYEPSRGLPNGSFTTLVLTESVPRRMANIADTYQYADSFLVYAKAFNPATKVFLYEVWHCLESGTPTGCAYDVDTAPWRQRLNDDLPMWHSVVDTLNARHPSPEPVCLIPGGQAMAALYDSIQAGNVPGISAIHQLFSDDIHLTDVGKYFVGCVHFATLYGTSPVGLPAQLQSMWGGAFDPPTPEQALVFQRIAWQVASTFPGHCMELPTAIADATTPPSRGHAYPNPTSDRLELPATSAHATVVVRDVLGRSVLTSTGPSLDVSPLPPGTYTAQVSGRTFRFLKD